MKNARRWAFSIIHNCLVHPMLPLGELAEAMGAKRVAGWIYKAHDVTVPEER